MEPSTKFRYLVDTRRVELHAAEDAVGVRFDDAIPTQERIGIAESSAAVGPIRSRYEVPAEKFTIYLFSKPHHKATVGASTAIQRLSQSSDVRRTQPVFTCKDKRIMATDRLLIRCFRASHQQKVEALGLSVVDVLAQTLICQVPDDLDVLEMASRLAVYEWVHYVEPDFITIGTHPRPPAGTDTAPSAPDRLQYAVTITAADRAWEKQRGRPEILIAILDDGMDIHHSDLAPAVRTSFDAISDSVDSLNPWDSHGTRCAGIAAGTDKAGSGVSGIGRGCSLMMVRIAATPYKGAPWSTTNSRVRRGIDWAMENGAAILNCSWGGSAPSNLIADAIEEARSRGRGGKGCVVIAAAGNAGGPVDFPASLPGVLAVSGTNGYDEFKTRESRDGEDWWGSNYGPEIDLAAPSVHIRTTDISGSGGVSPGDYVNNFNGTSAAAPIVAGAAGLILSAVDGLREPEVRRALTESSDKIEGYSFSGGRNDRLGSGRLNVYRALQSVLHPGKSLAGVVRQAGTGQPRAGAFYLEKTDGSASYLLQTHSPETAHGTARELAEKNLSALAPFAEKPVRITYTHLQKTPDGQILWGVDLQLGEGTEPTETIPPNEVRLGGGESSAPAKRRTDEEIPPDEVRMGYVEPE